MSLLPSRPRFSNISFTYTYNWDRDYINTDAEFSFDVHSKRAERFSFYETDSNLFPSDYIFFSIIEDYEIPEQMHFNYYEDWGVYICMKAANQFGYVNSDTICTTSYIKDEVIIKRLQELDPTGINDLYSNKNPTCGFVYKNHIINFITVMKFVQLYDIAGKISLSVHDVKSVDTSHLSTGLYIVKYKDTDNFTKTNKIFIR